jgi:hypothetical protein
LGNAAERSGERTRGGHGYRVAAARHDRLFRVVARVERGKYDVGGLRVGERFGLRIRAAGGVIAVSIEPILRLASTRCKNSQPRERHRGGD